MSSEPNIPVFLSEIALGSSGACAEDSASDGFLSEDESLFSNWSVSDEVLGDIYGPNLDPAQSEEPTSPVKITRRIRIFPPISTISQPPLPMKLNSMGMRSPKGDPLLIAYTTINWPISSVLILKLGENMLELYSYQHNYAV